MEKQLLREYSLFNYDKQSIEESIAKNNGRLIVSGLLQRANAKNWNGRKYPKLVLERECERYIREEIAQRRALGELDHPDSNIVNLKNVSHNILEIWWEGDGLYGKVEILSTPSGNILKELFRSGIAVGISSRGMGSVKTLYEDDGDYTMEVQPDFELVCWDFVSNPSTHNAFMNPVNESKMLAQTNIYKKQDMLIHDILCTMSGNCCI